MRNTNTTAARQHKADESRVDGWGTMADPINRHHPFYDEWNRVRRSLIDGRTVASRMGLASIVRGLRGRDEHSSARAALGYAAWIGFPISDAFLDNRYPA